MSEFDNVFAEITKPVFTVGDFEDGRWKLVPDGDWYKTVTITNKTHALRAVGNGLVAVWDGKYIANVDGAYYEVEKVPGAVARF